MTTARVQLQAALAYAAAGLLVFPTDSAKHPLVRWKDAATTDPGIVRSWWARYPLAGIGWALPDRLVVVDIDPGGEADVGGLGELPRTGPIARTPRGGWHVFLSLPDEGPWRQRQLAPKIDSRVGGLGIVVLPPGRGRSWRVPVLWPLTDLVNPDRLPQAPAPVVNRLRVLPEPAQPSSLASGGPIDALARAVAAAQQGSRNALLYWAAHRARDDGWALGDAMRVLVDAAMATRQPDEPPDDYRHGVVATIQSAYR